MGSSGLAQHAPWVGKKANLSLHAVWMTADRRRFLYNICYATFCVGPQQRFWAMSGGFLRSCALANTFPTVEIESRATVTTKIGVFWFSSASVLSREESKPIFVCCLGGGARRGFPFSATWHISFFGGAAKQVSARCRGAFWICALFRVNSRRWKWSRVLP